MNAVNILGLLAIACILMESVVCDDVMLGDPLINDGTNDDHSRTKRQTTQFTFKVDTAKKAFTSAEKSSIVRYHNTLRAGVSPKAGNMQYMTWHDTLAAMAQNWTNRCNFAHGNPTVSNPPYTWIGQNLFGGTGGYNESYAIQKWYNETSNYIYSNNTCKTGQVCGHYTQVVWANTNRVGCGITFCPTLATMTNAYFIACNYGPGGNYVGQRPYVSSATSCGSTTCPTGTTCSNSLCTPSPKCSGVTCANYDVNTCVCP